MSSTTPKHLMLKPMTSRPYWSCTLHQLEKVYLKHVTMPVDSILTSWKMIWPFSVLRTDGCTRCLMPVPRFPRLGWCRVTFLSLEILTHVWRLCQLQKIRTSEASTAWSRAYLMEALPPLVIMKLGNCMIRSIINTLEVRIVGWPFYLFTLHCFKNTLAVWPREILQDQYRYWMELDLYKTWAKWENRQNYWIDKIIYFRAWHLVAFCYRVNVSPVFVLKMMSDKDGLTFSKSLLLMQAFHFHTGCILSIVTQQMRKVSIFYVIYSWVQ